MDPAEIEFLAEKYTVKIVPNFTSNILYLLEGDVGPFNAGLSLEVPIWLATDLRQRQKCRILQPDWMDIDILEDAKEREKEEALFTELPNPQIFVAANLILDVATSDISKADEIKTIIKGNIHLLKMLCIRKILPTIIVFIILLIISKSISDIWDIRQSKLRKIVDSFVMSGSLRATLDHVQLIEINTIRPLLPLTLDHIHRLEMSGADARNRLQTSNIQNNSTVDRSLLTNSIIY